MSPRSQTCLPLVGTRAHHRELRETQREDFSKDEVSIIERSICPVFTEESHHGELRGAQRKDFSKDEESIVEKYICPIATK